MNSCMHELRIEMIRAWQTDTRKIETDHGNGNGNRNKNRIAVLFLRLISCHYTTYPIEDT